MAKSLLVAVFSLFSTLIFAQGQGSPDAKPKRTFDANEVIFGHIKDAHEFHFFSYRDKSGEVHHATISLPVIIYSSQKGWSVFMSSRFHHGEKIYEGYKLLTVENIEEMMKENPKEAKKFHQGQIVAVNANGEIDKSIKIYDISPTRNVVQMLIALALLVWVMLAVARKYKNGEGVATAPKGGQGLLEPVIIFITDDVAKPNLGRRYKKYLPFIQTVFFFILINSLVGLIPGTANVTGNIAFTFVLAIISFIVILASSNKHYWAHIFWPPVPHWIKPILIPVEILGVFTKPFALMIRLFANMVAGHIMIICLISLIFIIGALNAYAGWGASVFSIAFTIFIYFIEILVAFLQAYIFTNLTAVFVGQAFEGSHDDTDHHEDAVIV